jgi:aerobic carbon-monoxide dehydrogenase large subunit
VESLPGTAQAVIGDAVRRKEDDRLIVGGGCYADDLDARNAAWAVFVRSPHAHAGIVAIDTAQARAAPGVLAVYTGADTAQAGLKPIPHAVGSSHLGSDVPLRNRDGSERLTTEQIPLPTDRARFVGEAVAMVVAESLAAAKDAAERVEIEWEILPAVTFAADAVEDGAPSVWNHISGNVALDAEIGDPVATDAAFAQAAHRVRLETRVNRVTGVHLEPRAVIASYDAETGRYLVHLSHGLGVVQMRIELASVLGVAPEQIRVVAPRDVGGNFGTRNATHPDFALVAFAARMIGRPVKHVADRTESFVSDYQGRDLTVTAELALDHDGNFLAMRSSNLSNIGAHSASFVPLNKGVQLMTSLYTVPTAHYRARAALTNTPSTIPFRSAGRPEAMYVMERLIDLAARQCGFDRVELRRRNMIPAKALPWRNPVGVTYDSGDYAGAMQWALEIADWKGFPARRRAARKRGRLAGIAVANYIEATSGVPRERADLTILPEGRVDLVIGTQPTGQGHETSFSQIVADWLGVPFKAVGVRFGDTDFVKAGGGSHSGRSIRFGSIVIRAAADEIIQKGREIAALLLQAPVERVRFVDGRFEIADTDRSLGLFEIATAAAKGSELPDNLRGPLTGSGDRVTPGLCFPYGTCVCEVEVDPETGRVAIVRYSSIDDVGRAVNPLILHGQTHGGIAHGVGQALMEECWYDRENGQMLSASLMDYALPRATDLPSFGTGISEVPASSHPLGFRSGGEGGTTPALGAVINAIVDALWHLGVRHVEMPATPQKVWQAIQDAEANRAAAR